LAPASTLFSSAIPARRADNTDSAKKSAVVDLLQWMLTKGQKECSALGYAPLPSDLAARELQSLDAIK